MGEDEEKKNIPVKAVGGGDNFLNFLRASNPGAYHGNENDDTLRASNGNGQGHKQTPSNLSDLFDPPPPQYPNSASVGWSSPASPGSLSSINDVQLPSGPLPPRPPPPARPAPIHNRNRSVSFDKDVLRHKPASDTVLQQPTVMEDLEEESVASRFSAAQRAADGRPTLGGRTISVNLGQLGNREISNRKLTIDDLLGTGKYETEAETSILKALEEHQQQNAPPSHQRFQSETSTILTGVPDNLAHDFSLEGGSAEGNTADSAIKRNASHDDEDTHSSRSSQMNKQQSVPLINRDRMPKQSSHRKTMSVEDRLAGLTFAMWNMEDDGSDDFGEMRNTPEPSSGSSGDQFSRDAALVAGHDSPMPLRNRLNTGGSNFHGLPAVNEDEESQSSDDNKVTNSSSGDEGPGCPDVESNHPTSGREHRKRRRNQRRSTMITGAADKLKDDWDIWKTFFRPRREHMLAYLKRILCWVLVPFIGIAAIIFYFAENPPTGKSVEGQPNTDPSASWWLLFVVRQICTASLALGLQVFVIDFMCIGTKGMLRLLGPLLTLLLVQSKGWPFVVFCWSLLDFGMLYGDNAFVHHWGYWQDYVGLFNAENPSGDVVGSDWNKTVLLIGVTVSVFVALKRFVVGLLLGRQTFRKFSVTTCTFDDSFLETHLPPSPTDHYGEQLATIMNKMVLIGEVGHLSKRIFKSHTSLKEGAAVAAA
jgi:hypothetical protein